MRPATLVSLTAGLAAALVLVVVAPAPGGLAALTNWPPAWPMIVKLAAGSAVAFCTVWLVCRYAIDEPVRRLAGAVAEAGTAEHSIKRDAAAPHWLRPLTIALSRGLRASHAQLQSATSRRRELELLLRVAEAERSHAHAILRSISDAVIVTDAFNELWTANEAASQIFGTDLLHCGRKPVEAVISDRVLIGLIKEVRDAGDTAERRRLEHRITRSSRHFIYDVTLTCVANDEHEVTGVVTVMRDITREKQIAEMKSDFVSGVSHELRTPLSSVKAYVEMLVDGEAADEETRREFYNIIQSETNRLSRLIDNILNISRIESGISRVQREALCVSQAVREAMEVMQPQAHARQIHLRSEIGGAGENDECRVYADREMMLQAVLNLLSNAIKYSRPGGSVWVEIESDEKRRMVHMSVVDTGVGIPPEDLPYLWEKFYRVADHKKIAKGTGLGLNLVKHVVETVHGGKVSVHSRVGEGSRFTISLPLLEGVANAADVHESRPGGRKGIEYEPTAR